MERVAAKSKGLAGKLTLTRLNTSALQSEVRRVKLIQLFKWAKLYGRIEVWNRKEQAF